MTRILLFLFLVPFISCKENSTSNNERMLKIKEKELELREREIALREKENLKPLTKENNSLSELFRENKDAVFLVFAGNDYSSSQGSGFFIREDGIGVSNYHVFEDAEQALIKTNDGKSYMITEILNYSKEKDFIVFKISNTTNNNFKSVVFANISPEIGEDCFAIGNPKGLEQTLSKGIISAFREDYIQTTAQITHGSSGGALFNNKGEVIGITTMGLNEADLNFALNTVNFDFYRENKIRRSPIAVQKNHDFNKTAIQVIENYFTALSENDFARLETIFANRLTRFYNEFNFSKQKAIADHKNYAKTYPYPKCKIDYNSIKMNRDYDGSILINLYMDFTIKKNSWNASKTFTYDMYIKLNSNFEINSVFTNIINSK
ncbi:serine protease [Empedobacter sp. 225-1]|uniref:S1C family serine protease n=1 Tax=unclassified Empedobacter TaxID=2643773 RepID=UPI002579121D|nr:MULTISPECIES: S1C family serine protease [unclassified Empedobacter]MDM1524283.1 serine protease [Empedobacter sp. 225-1]MDM1544201.1 serine protease [Empedobacter sp. 189-2]